MAVSAYRLARGVFVGVAGFVLMQACSSRDDSSSPGVGTRGGAGGAEGGSQQVMPDVTTPPTTGGNGGDDPLCGIVDCVPDEERSCAAFLPTQALLLALAGAGGAAGSAGDGGTSAGADPGTGPGAGGFSSGGASGADSTAGAAGNGDGRPNYACRVLRERTGNRESSRATCAPTGRGQSDDPCFSGSDCGEGLGCVTDGAIARCRPYCCMGESTCDQHPGTYCSSLRLQDDTLTANAGPVLVPVCTPADDCDLAEPYPCTAGRTCQCPTATACLVARPDGTTTCGRPGSGKADEPCPCDAGFVCSQSVGTCLKLCQPSENVPGCGDGRCQASAELPTGWGVCVGR